MRPWAVCSLTRHLVSSWYQAQASFPIWWRGWLSEKGLKRGLAPSFRFKQLLFPPNPRHSEAGWRRL